MTGSSDNPAEPPRRRRRASRRAAGPPVSVSTMATAETDDPDVGVAESRAAAASAEPGAESARSPGGSERIEVATADPAAADPTIGAEDTTMDVGAVVGGGAASPAAAAAAAAAATVDDSGHAHGSPAGAPEHQPGPAVHGHSGGQAHSPGQGHSSSAGRDRSGERHSTGVGAVGEPPRRSGRPTREEASERSLRSLVTTRSTQVSPTAALRAREVALPAAADLEAAEADLTIVRRHYVPPTTLAAGRRQDWPNRRGPNGQGARPAGS